MRIPNQKYVDISHFRAPYKDSAVDGGGGDNEMNGYGVYSGVGFGADPAPAPASASRTAAISLDTGLVPPVGGEAQSIAVIVGSDAQAYLDSLSAMGVSGEAVTAAGPSAADMVKAATLVPSGQVTSGMKDARSWVYAQAKAGAFVLAPRTYDPFASNQKLVATGSAAVITQYAQASAPYAVLQKPVVPAAAPAPVYQPAKKPFSLANMSPGSWAIVALAGVSVYMLATRKKGRRAAA